MKLEFNLDRKTIIIIALAILLLLGGAYHFWKEGKHNAQHDLDLKLRNALTDTVKTYQNKRGEWVSEKLTLQAELKDLTNKNLVLSTNQKDLLNRVKEIDKDNQVISAALIEMGIKLDDLINKEGIVINDSTIKFESPKGDSSLIYDIAVNGVKPFNGKRPSLEFKKFELPNKQFIEFHWKDERKEGYPVTFSVTNTNPHYKVYNIDSYAIPELTRANVKPTFWMKLGNLTKTTGGRLVVFGAGFIAGGALVLSSK